jgi:TetR/AcrR family transcriptional regulator, regulator of mycofactocin system
MVRISSVARGRQQTSIEAIEKVALEVFAARGFEDTPVEDIAAAAGISRRTFFRYFGSKSDIPFGDYATLLQDLEQWLMAEPDDRPMFEVIAEGVQRFNRMHTDGPVAHRERMELIMHTPALRANAAIRHSDWLAVVARYAARRMGLPFEDLGPQLAAQVSLGASSAAYELWLSDESSDLMELIDRSFAMVQMLPEPVVPKARSPRRRPMVTTEHRRQTGSD